MSKILTGNEPAMPTLLYNEESGNANGHEPRLTIRQHFAAMAMQGILSSWPLSDIEPYVDPAYAVKMAVEYSDALINELNKQ
jgi:hypothetical protein